MVIELDGAGGGTVTFPDSGRTQVISDCVDGGTTLTCRLMANGMAGEIEIARREGGVDGRARQESDNEWASFSAETVSE